MDRSEYPTRLRRLRDRADEEIRAATPAERVRMVWPMTLHAWSFLEGRLDEPRLRRDVVRVVRRRS